MCHIVIVFDPLVIVSDRTDVIDAGWLCDYELGHNISILGSCFGP